MNEDGADDDQNINGTSFRDDWDHHKFNKSGKDKVETKNKNAKIVVPRLPLKEIDNANDSVELPG